MTSVKVGEEPLEWREYQVSYEIFGWSDGSQGAEWCGWRHVFWNKHMADAGFPPCKAWAALGPPITYLLALPSPVELLAQAQLQRALSERANRAEELLRTALQCADDGLFDGGRAVDGSRVSFQDGACGARCLCVICEIRRYLARLA